ncbi:hypothetical protein AB0N06_33750 [Streptomyces sp. NPDC051020]|uniref:hypothetical protein n=1 Tax=Streptomyces sp. NPDC051020 TaxID=3155409 RepID=UPI003449177D
MCISLCGLDMVACREGPALPVQQWLDRTWVAVPPGTEGTRLDLDAALAQLLGDG